MIAISVSLSHLPLFQNEDFARWSRGDIACACDFHWQPHVQTGVTERSDHFCPYHRMYLEDKSFHMPSLPTVTIGLCVAVERGPLKSVSRRSRDCQQYLCMTSEEYWFKIPMYVINLRDVVHHAPCKHVIPFYILCRMLVWHGSENRGAQVPLLCPLSSIAVDYFLIWSWDDYWLSHRRSSASHPRVLCLLAQSLEMYLPMHLNTVQARSPSLQEKRMLAKAVQIKRSVLRASRKVLIRPFRMSMSEWPPSREK